MSPLEVSRFNYANRRWMHDRTVQTGTEDTVKTDGANSKRLLLACSRDDSHSTITELIGSIRIAGFVGALSEGLTERVNQGRELTLTFNPGRRGESRMRFRQVPQRPTREAWQRTGRSR